MTIATGNTIIDITNTITDDLTKADMLSLAAVYREDAWLNNVKKLAATNPNADPVDAHIDYWFLIWMVQNGYTIHLTYENPGGQHIVALGTDNLKNKIEESNTGYYVIVRDKDGNEVAPNSLRS